jgi:hypothetical protein
LGNDARAVLASIVIELCRTGSAARMADHTRCFTEAAVPSTVILILLVLPLLNAQQSD